MVSRHLSRSLGKKIASRGRLSPAAMEIDPRPRFRVLLLEPARPVRIYSQGAYGYMQAVNGSYDIMWSTVTMDNGVLVSIGGGWNLPPSYPNYCARPSRSRERRLLVSRRYAAFQLAQYDQGRHTISDVDHAGRVGRSRLCRADGARDDALPRMRVAGRAADGVAGKRAPGDETYLAADLSAESGTPINLPLDNQRSPQSRIFIRSSATPV